MNKLALSAAVAALALSPVLSQAAHADDSTPTYGANVNPNWQDNFFVDGQLGQTQARTSLLDHNNSVFQNVRFGWRWNGIVGAEIGYAYLGKVKNDFDFASTSAKPRVGQIGVTGKYNFYNNWFVTGHGGYLRSRTTGAVTVGDSTASERSWNNGWYAGAGVGYDVTKNVALGINYDNYHIKYGRDGAQEPQTNANVATYSASVEVKF